MGSSFSSPDSQDGSAAKIYTVKQTKKVPSNTKRKPSSHNDDDDDDELPLKSTRKALETPILLQDDDGDLDDSNPTDPSHAFPTPSGHEYDLIDKIASELPSVIDTESSQQVQDYIEACDNGRGPMVACYSTAEYLSLFLRKHKEAALLYENTCFRPGNDKSANGVSMDKGKSKAYPPSCFNLAQMRMTGKGNTKFSRLEGYRLFDRACRAGHGGSCMMQAKMLASYPGSLGKGIPYDPNRAASLLEGVCKDGDSLSCFTLATMLLRGDLVKPEADNVSPEEARGLAPIKKRKNEEDRTKDKADARVALKRDPRKAEELLLKACNTSSHAPSCYNLAVMYTQGDDGIEKNDEKAQIYQKKTEEFIEKFGGFGFGGGM
jgi:TPR repeat protein